MSNMSTSIRRATPDDVEAIMAIEAPVFGHEAWSSEAMARLGDSLGSTLGGSSATALRKAFDDTMADKDFLAEAAAELMRPLMPLGD